MLAQLTIPKRPSKRKATGAHYTPANLASFLAKRILAYVPRPSSALRVMDPSCGDGELLLSLARELSPSERASTEFIGIDQEKEAVENVRGLWPSHNIELRTEDFLSLSFDTESAYNLFDERANHLPAADIIIANPPYVRTQVLGAERAQQLALAFDLTGRVDLYQAFLVAMTRALKPGGLLGVITSNRFLSTRGGMAIRNFLSSNYDILEVIDLGDTKLFDAAVLPAIFIGRKRRKDDRHSHSVPEFLKVYEEFIAPPSAKELESIYDVLTAPDNGEYQVGNKYFKITRGTLSIGGPDAPWKLVCSSEQAWLQVIESRSSFLLGDLFHIRVGVKTTADKVFIRDDWTTIPADLCPEPELLLPIIDSSDCKRWEIDVTEVKRRLLYPYTVEQSKRAVVDLKAFPCAQNYFEHFRARLEGRTYMKESSRQWYEIWVPHHPNAWNQPMIVVPDISPEPKFLYTDAGLTINGNCYWMTLRNGIPKDYLFLVLGIANSSLMTHYHDLTFNNKLYSGRRRYLTQYLEKYPVPDISSPHAAEIITLVKQRLSPQTLARKTETERKIEDRVISLYGLSKE